MQVQADSINQRHLKLSTLIQSNCQYLTVLRKCITDTQKLYKNNLPLILAYLQQRKCKIYDQQFIQLFIQVAYFIFSCKRYNIQPKIGQQDIRVQQMPSKIGTNDKKFAIVIYYQISDIQILKPFQSIAIVKELYKFLFDRYDQYIKLHNNQFNTTETYYKNYIECFRKQVQYLYSNTKVYQPSKQKQFFLCLEETRLFREYSMLLKIKNNSMIDLIRTNEQNFLKFKQSKKNQVSIMISHGNEKKKQKPDHQKIRQNQRQIQVNITSLFKYLSLGEKSKSISIQSMQVGSLSKQKSQKVQFSYRLRQKPLSNFYANIRSLIPELPETMDEEINKNQFPEMEHKIEYASDRNSICVRLVPNSISVNIQNSDFLMYQSNVLTFQTVNTSTDIGGNKKLTKVLAFKGTSCLNYKEPPLQKILLLMDATMIAAKICQPELNPIKFINNRISDHQRLTLISDKINHYTRIYLRCAKKVYSQ